ncbi:MAG: hypothetical protein ACYC0V_04010 [Armatimonadota bacterium]
MKKLILLTALIIVTIITGACAADLTWQNQLKQIPEMAKVGLGITADQDKAFDTILTQICAEAKQVWSSSLSDSEKLTKLGALNGKFLTSSMDVLTKQQLDTALSLGSVWLQTHQGVAILKTEVVPCLKMCGLTDTQMTLIDKSIASHITSAASIGKDAGLTAEQKDTALWKQRKTTYDAIYAGLQPDQQTAMGIIFKSAITNCKAIRDNLPADLKPKFDTFVKAGFTFAESKITLK